MELLLDYFKNWLKIPFIRVISICFIVIVAFFIVYKLGFAIGEAIMNILKFLR